MKEKIETVLSVSALILVVIIFCIEFAKPIDNYYISTETENGIHYTHVIENKK